jgi:hypothetical protein
VERRLEPAPLAVTVNVQADDLSEIVDPKGPGETRIALGSLSVM